MNIILIGFMASGKTTIGKALSTQTGMKLLDTDAIVEEQQGMEIKDIFSLHGEAYFRLKEKEAILCLSKVENCIISVGGGAVMFHDNLQTLKKIGTTVFLDAPLSKILNNLKGKFRPLVGNTIEETKMKELLERRYPTYMKADIVINTEHLDVQQTVDAIVSSIGL